MRLRSHDDRAGAEGDIPPSNRPIPASEGPLTAIDWLRNHAPTTIRPALGALHGALDARFSSDKGFIERQYAHVFGRVPDLTQPRTLNEKVQWRKLYDRRPLYQIVSDKVAARDYLANRVGPDHLVPILGVFRKPEDIPWAELPTPYVIKAAHGSGWNRFVFDSAEVDLPELVHTLRRWLRTNYYYQGREWAYKGIPRRLIIEHFIGRGREAPQDFKFFCFDGVPQAIYVLQDRFTRSTITWYDTQWVFLPFSMHSPQGPTQPAPGALDEMLVIARKLSRGTDFLRVDLYCVDGRVYCGELTVYPGCGLDQFTPPERDEWLGGFWKLPVAKSTR
jgi:hypothetical protein